MPEVPQYGQLVVDQQLDGPDLVVRVGGELDLTNADRLKDALGRAQRDHKGAITLDLSGLDFLDSTGISILVQASQQSKTNGRRLRIRGATGQVKRVLEVTGVHGHLIEDPE
jgi:anti-sigma B factor antagonist